MTDPLPLPETAADAGGYEPMAFEAWFQRTRETPGALPPGSGGFQVSFVAERAWHARDAEVAALATRVAELDDVLRSLACWLSVGGYNSDKVDPEVFEKKIRDGVDMMIRIETERARGPRNGEQGARIAELETEVEDRRTQVQVMIDDLSSAREERDKLQAFKTWVHAYLDTHGVPHHPPGTHGEAGCRIGDRMDWLMEKVAGLEQWKREAIAVMPDFQEIGKLLGVRIGESVHDKIVPGIRGIIAERDRLRTACERIAGLTVVVESHADCGNVANHAIEIASAALLAPPPATGGPP